MTIRELLQQRSKAVGALLAQARRVQHRNINDCATRIGTSRRRYRAIEAGDVDVSFVELESLAEYLHIPFHSFWQDTDATAQSQRLVVQARPGDVVHIRIELHP